MKKNFFWSIPILAFCAGVIFLVIVFQTRSNQQHETTNKPEPQCAHWVMFRVAQLLGLPTEPGEMQRLLPFQPNGHSLLQVTETLTKIGIKATGYRDNWDSLAKISFPCIAHLQSPDHYIVVSGIEPEQGYVHIFDFDGQRTRQKREAFEKRWTGYTLHIEKDKSFFNSKINGSFPRVVFDHLILDKGDIPAVGEPIEFVFPVYNTGTTDLIIEDVKVNCGCLKSEKPNHAIPPGKGDVVKLFYSIEPKHGVFEQTAAIKTSDPNNPIVVIAASGFTGVDVRINPTKIYLDTLFLGKNCNYSCFIRYTGEWNDFQVDVESVELVGVKLLSYDYHDLDKVQFSKLIPFNTAKMFVPPKVIQNNRVFEFVFEPTGKLGSSVNGSIILKTNVSGYEKFTLNVDGTIKSPIQAFPSVIDFTNKTNESITILSRNQEPFQIVEFLGDNVTCQFDKEHFQQDHKLLFKKSGNLESNLLHIKYRFQDDPAIFELPLITLTNVH
jgi:predicted double-glycine peptidase